MRGGHPGPSTTASFDGSLPLASDTSRSGKNDGSVDEGATSSVAQAKRREIGLATGSKTRSVLKGALSKQSGRPATQHASSQGRDRETPSQTADIASVATRPSQHLTGNAGQRRRLPMGLHNHPIDHHPVGIAIWVIQKFDAARRERSCSISSIETPSRDLTVSLPAAGPIRTPNEGLELQKEIHADRRQAQRQRRSQQRLESNWVKSKENELVARVRREADQKHGSCPSTEHSLPLSNVLPEGNSPTDEKEAYTRSRIRDDFSQLMEKQVMGFADVVSRLGPFQPGFSQKYSSAIQSAAKAHATLKADPALAAASRLLMDVLPALAERSVSRASQLAADNLIQALQTESLSADIFVDAIAILSQRKDILEGTDHVLTQLFSRPVASNTKEALRTSSTIVPTMHDTIDRAKLAMDTVHRDPGISIADSDPLPARASVRERKPTSKMIGISGFSRSVRSPKSTSARTSSSRAPKTTRSSKLRGSVPFETSQPSLSKHDQLSNSSVAASHPYLGPRVSSGKLLPRSHYEPQQGNPKTKWHRFPHLQTEADEQLVQNLFDLALLASREDSESLSSTCSSESSSQHQWEEQEKTDSHQFLRTNDTGARRLLKADLEPGPGELDERSCLASSEYIAAFRGIMKKLTLERGGSGDVHWRSRAASYDWLTESTTFRKAKDFGFSYPEIPRPFEDADGWRFSGCINRFGDEMVRVNAQGWAFPPNCSANRHPPLRRVKRKSRLLEEWIFGFPSITGGVHDVRSKRRTLEDDSENPVYEKLMFDVRQAAKARGLPFDRALSWEALAESIKAFDARRGINGTFEDVPQSPVFGFILEEPGGSTRRQCEVAGNLEAEKADDWSCQRSGRSVKKPRLSSEKIGLFRGSNCPVDQKGEKVSQKLKDPQRSTSLKSPDKITRATLSANMNEGGQIVEPPLSGLRVSRTLENCEKSGPPPAVTPGSFSALNRPLDSSDSSTTSPLATPALAQHPANHRHNQSISPAPTNQIGSYCFPSTDSITASSPAPSTHSLDSDNINPYSTASRYNSNRYVSIAAKPPSSSASNRMSTGITSRGTSANTTRASSHALHRTGSNRSSSIVSGASLATSTLPDGESMNSGSDETNNQMRREVNEQRDGADSTRGRGGSGGSGSNSNSGNYSRASARPHPREGGMRRKSQRPDFKMTINNNNNENSEGGNGTGDTVMAAKAQPKAVKGGEVLKFV